MDDPQFQAPRSIALLSFDAAHPKQDPTRPTRAAMRVASAYCGSFGSQASVASGQSALEAALGEKSSPLFGRTDSGDTFFHELARRWSAHNRDLGLVLARALRAGASIDSPNCARRTPLHVAAFLGNANVVEALVKAGHGVDPYDISGDTPLFDAAASGSLECCQLLIGAGAKARWRNSAGEYAWERALARQRQEAGRFLLSVVEAAQLGQEAAPRPAGAKAARL